MALTQTATIVLPARAVRTTRPARRSAVAVKAMAPRDVVVAARSQQVREMESSFSSRV